MKKYYIQYLILLVIFILSCEEDEEKKHPSIKTDSVEVISRNEIQATGTIQEWGDYKVLGVGFEVENTENSNYYPNNLIKEINIDDVQGDILKANIVLSNSFIRYYGNGSLSVKAYIRNTRGTLYAKGLAFDLPSITVTGVTPANPIDGQEISISGNNFGNDVDDISVVYGSENLTVTYVSNTLVKAIIKRSSYSSSTKLSVYIQGEEYVVSYDYPLAFEITGFSPVSGYLGSQITITTSGIQNYQDCYVYVDSLKFSTYVYYNKINVTVPSSITKTTVKIYVEKGGIKKEAPGEFTVLPPKINSVSKKIVYPGYGMVITTEGFGSGVKFYIGETLMTGNFYSNRFNGSIPLDIVEGSYTVSAQDGIFSAEHNEQVQVVHPKITSFSPDSGYTGTQVEIKGENLDFGESYIPYVYMAENGRSISPTFKSDTLIRFNVPSLLGGKYRIFLRYGENKVYTDNDFIFVEPNLESFSPTTGKKGDKIAITGTGFPVGNTVSLYFGSTMVAVSPLSDKLIEVAVPDLVTAGEYDVRMYINRNNYYAPGKFTFTL